MSETKTSSSKLSRHREIARLLNDRPVRSQSELQKLLQAAGVAVTQATLSRDLEELAATKVRDATGNLRYAMGGVPENAEYPLTLPGTLERWCLQLLMGVDLALNQVVLHTPPGAASALAAALDKEIVEGALGCIAGDNTVLVICEGVEAAAALAESLRGMTQR